MANHPLRLSLPLIAAACVLIAVAMLGRWAREGLRDDYLLPFASIQCLPPPGPEQKDLLAEVQYLAGMSDQVHLLDDDLAERLRQAFAEHPWVAAVDGVNITSRRIEVRLRYRKPVLAVPFEGRVRAVDEYGILLPTTANTMGLRLYDREAAPPAGPAGTAWGDPCVEKAARESASARGNKPN